jgi:hypothetical protein
VLVQPEIKSGRSAGSVIHHVPGSRYSATVAKTAELLVAALIFRLLHHAMPMWRQGELLGEHEQS